MAQRAPPSALASLVYRVPKVADVVAYNLNYDDTTDLMIKTEPAIYEFCRGPGGGLDRFMKISQRGKKRKKHRKHIARLPSPPRLLVVEWREKLMGKCLVAEDAENSDKVGFIPSSTPLPRNLDRCEGVSAIWYKVMKASQFRCRRHGPSNNLTSSRNIKLDTTLETVSSRRTGEYINYLDLFYYD